MDNLFKLAFWNIVKEWRNPQLNAQLLKKNKTMANQLLFFKILYGDKFNQ